MTLKSWLNKEVSNQITKKALETIFETIFLLETNKIEFRYISDLLEYKGIQIEDLFLKNSGRRQ